MSSVATAVDQSLSKSKSAIASGFTICTEKGFRGVSFESEVFVIHITGDVTKHFGEASMCRSPQVSTQRFGREVQRLRGQTPGRQVAAPTPDPMMMTIYGKSRSGT